MVPLAPLTPHVREIVAIFLASNIPSWANFLIHDSAEYLGIWLGPGAHKRQWISQISKYLARVNDLASAQLAATITVEAYDFQCITVFSYPLQFVPLPSNFIS